jgi:tight adherence protein B
MVGYPFLIALLASFAIFMALLRPAKSSRLTRRRLDTIQDSVRLPKALAFGDDLEAVRQQGFSDRLGAMLERYRFSKKLRVLLIHAGSNMGVGGAVLVSAGCGFACGLICFLALQVPLAAGVAAAGGLAIPYAVLLFKRRRRLKAFNAALPDAIDLMSRSLLAGHSMGSSIEMISTQSPEPLAFEFSQVFQQQRLGLHFRDALLQMGTRIPSKDLQFLITAILVQKETGGDLTEILARASYVIRERVRIEGEVQTRTAQGRLTGWILSLLPIVMLALINIITPGYSTVLFHDPTGRQLLYTGGALIVVGALIIRKIVDIQV